MGELLRAIEKTLTGLSFDIFDFAYPVAEVRSPWIEHLL
jgi:hypothetical protein